ncbi:hypothetical protein Trydic_g10199 [Trypoxylus dichotomus]
MQNNSELHDDGSDRGQFFTRLVTGIADPARHIEVVGNRRCDCLHLLLSRLSPRTYPCAAEQQSSSSEKLQKLILGKSSSYNN